jgi:hypothetical protein
VLFDCGRRGLTLQGFDIKPRQLSCQHLERLSDCREVRRDNSYDPAGTGQIFWSLVALHELFNNRRFDPQLRSSAYCVPSQRPFCSPFKKIMVHKPQAGVVGAKGRMVRKPK